MEGQTAAAVGPGAARTAMGHHRRRRGAWGRPQRVPVKSLNYKEKTEMREIPQNRKHAKGDGAKGDGVGIFFIYFLPHPPPFNFIWERLWREGVFWSAPHTISLISIRNPLSRAAALAAPGPPAHFSQPLMTLK